MEKHCMLGVKSVLLPKAYMKEGSVLGAMSLLNKKIEPWTIYVGVPAYMIKNRDRNVLECEKKFILEYIENRDL